MWKDLEDFYGAVDRRWKICMNCGFPSLGTGMHLELPGTSSSMHPAVIPTDYLMTRLIIIDVSTLARIDPAMILTLDVALQWLPLKHDPLEPTLLLFKFGWKEENYPQVRSCICKAPGISYDLAAWIANNLSHVVGVATDAPTLESEETREFTSRTVSNLLGKNGVYMIENVNFRRRLPEYGCMAIAMPLKLLNAYYVPTRLTAFCSTTKLPVVLALSKFGRVQKPATSRVYDVNLEEILN
ncbi:uncharacterized protein LOC115441559 [Manduca sexta]|nr:uncharacterized protein LOC115441559 [Manduca sexta]